MKKTIVIITGCAGLIGATFSKYLLDNNYHIVGIDDLSGGYMENVDARVKFYLQNLLDQKAVDRIFETEQPDYVFHFAAYAAEGLSPYIRNYNYSNNVLCSVNVINCCIRYNVKKIIFTSSMAVYGTGTPPFKESDIVSPEDPYGIAKYTIELDLKQAFHHFGLNYSILRPHNVIGIYQNIWDKYRNVIGIWIRQILDNKNISIFGDGAQTRAFSDIKFLMAPMEKLMFEHNGEVFNIGSDKYCQIKDVALIIKDMALRNGLKTDIEFLDARNEVKDAYCDHSKAKALLGFNDDTDLERAIVAMFDWARSVEPREVRQIEYEIHKGMYSYWK
jgi:UDP-glucose 4-epimerase